VLGKHGVFSISRCAGCGLVATVPQPDDQALAYYYRGAYSGAAGATPGAYQLGPMGRWTARRRVGVLRRHLELSAGTRVLEVGCGYGALLSLLHRECGCQAVGLDFDAGSIAGALDRDAIDYRVGTLETAELPPASFDAVLFFQSLEHLREPIQALRAATRLLKPGGVCVVEVPDFDGGWRHVFQGRWFPLLVPQHLFHFTPATLSRGLAAAGLEPEARHRSMFYPVESTVSFGLWLNGLLGKPLHRFRPRPGRPDGWLLLALVALWWVAVEIPTQALLVAAGRTGSQLRLARRPLADPGEPNHNEAPTPGAVPSQETP
jgi:SAM-dependent methyltransferase